MTPSQIIGKYAEEASSLRELIKTPALVIFVGVPGSGKTTLSKNIARKLPAVRVATDDLKIMLYGDESYDLGRLFEVQYKVIFALAKMGVHIISDANSAKETQRERLIALARIVRYRPVVAHCLTSTATIQQRISLRGTRFHPSSSELDRYQGEIEPAAGAIMINTDLVSEGKAAEILLREIRIICRN